jgi:hypothetical protein
MARLNQTFDFPSETRILTHLKTISVSYYPINSSLYYLSSIKAYPYCKNLSVPYMLFPNLLMTSRCPRTSGAKGMYMYCRREIRLRNESKDGDCIVVTLSGRTLNSTCSSCRRSYQSLLIAPIPSFRRLSRADLPNQRIHSWQSVYPHPGRRP